MSSFVPLLRAGVDVHRAVHLQGPREVPSAALLLLHLEGALAGVLDPVEERALLADELADVLVGVVDAQAFLERIEAVGVDRHRS
jgi:hypothetical protein